MARPIKKGLDYFPFDIDWKKGAMEYLYCMYGILGVAVVKLSLEPRIYGGEGYFVEYNERSSLIFSNEFGDQLSVVDTRDKKRPEIYDEIVQAAIEYGIFDKEMYKKYGILTSVDIQERYVRAKEKSQRVEMESRYLLLSDVKIPKNVDLIGVYGEETGVYYPENSTKESKVKKSIVKKSIVNKSKEEKRKNGGYDEILSVIEDEELKNLYYEFIKMRKLIKSPMTDRALITLIDKVNSLEPTNIEHRKQLLENSIVNNWKSVYPLKEDETDVKADSRKTFDNQNNQNIKKPQKSKFNNYDDGNWNRAEMEALEERLLDRMLEEAE